MFHEPYVIFLVLVVAWLVLLWALRRAGKVALAGEDPEVPRDAPDVAPGGAPEAKAQPFALAGPFLMWRTRKGRALIDRIAERRRFWRGFGDLSIALVAVAMVSMTFLLLWMAVLVVNIPREAAPTPDLVLGIPGVNRLIPITYGIFGLAVAIIIHEFCHGILARASRVRLNFLGLLFFIVPIGAFVEPDEVQMKEMPRRERARLYAAGPAVNLVFALGMAVVFSAVLMPSVTPVASGVGIADVIEGGPAQFAGIGPGMIVLAVNDTATPRLASFTSVLGTTVANQTVNVTYTAKGWDAPVTRAVTMADAFAYTENVDRAGKGFLGVVVFPRDLTTAYFHPIGGAGELGGLLGSMLTYVSLPFAGLQPMEGLALSFYEVHGPLAGMGDLFWILANSFYWLFWLNLMLGLTNALPAVPLDGGYLFRDGLHALMGRVRSGLAPEARDRIVKNVSYVFALLILALILWQFIGPFVL